MEITGKKITALSNKFLCQFTSVLNSSKIPGLPHQSNDSGCLSERICDIGGHKEDNFMEDFKFVGVCYIFLTSSTKLFSLSPLDGIFNSKYRSSISYLKVSTILQLHRLWLCYTCVNKGTCERGLKTSL